MLKKILKKWLIKKLGGYTDDDAENDDALVRATIIAILKDLNTNTDKDSDCYYIKNKNGGNMVITHEMRHCMPTDPLLNRVAAFFANKNAQGGPEN